MTNVVDKSFWPLRVTVILNKGQDHSNGTKLLSLLVALGIPSLKKYFAVNIQAQANISVNYLKQL